MRYFLSFAVSVLIVGFGQPLSGAPPDPDKAAEAAVRRYVAKKYASVKDQDGERVVFGLAYNSKAPLKPLKVSELGPFLPNTRFFVTRLDFPAWCYLRVELLIAVTPSDSGNGSGNDSGDDVRTCLSPTFAAASAKFLDLFGDISTKTDDDRKRLAIGIGKLFAAVTHEGQARRPSVGSGTAEIQLWNAKRHWRDITLVFDNKGNVQRVSIHKTERQRQNSTTGQPAGGTPSVRKL
jgi:hypothetical protein